MNTFEKQKIIINFINVYDQYVFTFYGIIKRNDLINSIGIDRIVEKKFIDITKYFEKNISNLFLIKNRISFFINFLELIPNDKFVVFLKNLNYLSDLIKTKMHKLYKISSFYEIKELLDSVFLNIKSIMDDSEILIKQLIEDSNYLLNYFSLNFRNNKL